MIPCSGRSSFSFFSLITHHNRVKLPWVVKCAANVPPLQHEPTTPAVVAWQARWDHVSPCSHQLELDDRTRNGVARGRWIPAPSSRGCSRPLPETCISYTPADRWSNRFAVRGILNNAPRRSRGISVKYSTSITDESPLIALSASDSLYNFWCYVNLSICMYVCMWVAS